MARFRGRSAGRASGQPAEPQDAPADMAAARKDIEAAFGVLFGIDSDARQRLGVVDGGDDLYALWGTESDRFVAELPSFSVQVTNVFFDSPTSAKVEYRLQSSYTGEVWRTEAVTATPDGWKVSASTLCSNLDLLGVGCPATVASTGIEP